MPRNTKDATARRRGERTRGPRSRRLSWEIDLALAQEVRDAQGRLGTRLVKADPSGGGHPDYAYLTRSHD